MTKIKYSCRMFVDKYQIKQLGGSRMETERMEQYMKNQANICRENCEIDKNLFATMLIPKPDLHIKIPFSHSFD